MRLFATASDLTGGVPYHGPELRAHYLRTRFGLLGDAAAIWRGPCHVATADLVDLEDQEAATFIQAQEMVHLLVECFEAGLSEMVLLQRLLVARAGDLLQSYLQPEQRLQLRRAGDDLYVGDRKLTVSIATLTGVSGVIHLGINIDPAGAPVAAIGLLELGVDADNFAEALLSGVVDEAKAVTLARAKVRMADSLGKGS